MVSSRTLMFTQAVVAVEAKAGRSLQEEFQDNLVSENKEQTNKNPSVLRGLYNVLSYTYIVCLFFMCKCFIYNFVVVKSCLACSLLIFPLCFILCIWEFCLHVHLCSVGG